MSHISIISSEHDLQVNSSDVKGTSLQELAQHENRPCNDIFGGNQDQNIIQQKYRKKTLAKWNLFFENVCPFFNKPNDKR